MAKFSPDGRYALFTSDMNGSPRSDLFVMELPSR
jgi:Tol biopolymer transport system component